MSIRALSHGLIEVTDSGDPNSDVVKVDVHLKYHDEAVPRLAKVCLLQKEDNQNGVGIFVSHFYPM